jgi:hypothetical protein
MVSLRKVIARIFEPAIAEDQAAAKLGRDLTKWVFDLARNLIVLGALRYFSDKTGNIYVSMVFNLCLGALVLYILTYWQIVYLRIFGLIARNSLTEILDLALNVVVGLVMLLASLQVISAIAGEIARIQAS